ncbi:probable serine/threonine-protein kinase DDB_G0282963 [Panonychus citri]|uniref:probable serine/threonine-protein kinase DDB_G0282963 n=1 Tax=Panonychus citri TaxID=50023 RepID=UPI0023076F14|nr:probable serine/threonine-protein kinase DDB_G0282963 [Panonychus citri]
MTTSSNYGKINGSTKGNRCSCCPYGCHVDVEFVQYCESLLASWYNKQLSSASASSKGSFSLNRPPKRRILTSTTSLPNDEATYQWLVDQNTGRTNGHSKTINNNHSFHYQYPLNNNNNNNTSSPTTTTNGHQSLNLSTSSNFLYRLRPVGRSNSSSRVHDILNPPSPIDKSLTDAVELFEKVLKEHEQAAFSYSVPNSPSPYFNTPSPLQTSTPTRRASLPRYIGNTDLINPNGNVSSPNSPNPVTGSNHLTFESQSPGVTPTGYSNNNSYSSNSNNVNHHNHNGSINNNNKTFLNHFRDQLQVSVQKMRDLEQQVKNIPVLKQQIALLQAERKRLLEKVNDEKQDDTKKLVQNCDSINPIQRLTTEEIFKHEVDVNLPLNSNRIEELEKNGIITPPLTRRKFLLFKTNSNLPDDQSQVLLSKKNEKNSFKLKMNHSPVNKLSLSSRDSTTQTDTNQLVLDKQQIDSSVNKQQLSSSSPSSIKSKSFKHNLSVNNKVTCVSIRPSTLTLTNSLSSSSSQQSATVESHLPGRLTTTPTHNLTPIFDDLPSPKTFRSIGISVNIAPTLPRRSLVSLRESDLKKVQSNDENKQQQDQYQQQVSSLTPTALTTLPSLSALPNPPLLTSRGTNPMPLDRSEAITQATPRTLHASVGTDHFHLHDVGINFDYRKDLHIRDFNRSNQTDSLRTQDAIVQVNGKCSNCELKQMETVGVGSGPIYLPSESIGITNASEVGVNTEIYNNHGGVNTRMVDSMISSISSMASSIQSIKLCDKCNETITSLAREVVINKDKQIPSPGIGSRIPRLSASLPPLPPTQQQHQQSSSMPLTTTVVTETTSSTTEGATTTTNILPTTTTIKSTNLANKIIIEEGNDDEILVFRDPNASLGSRKHRSNFPSMMTPQVDLEGIRLLDEACKITDSEESEDDDDDDDDDPESFSSIEGTYILDEGVIVPGGRRQVQNSTKNHNNNVDATNNINNVRLKKIIEPSKELRAALKVLNDSLLKPDLSNKPATAKSIQIIEKEWFSIAACKDSDPLSIEKYLDCFESFSTHLLNKIVNLTDSSGNTAMHYAISHSNFDVVSVLLDSKVCDVNKQNKAGYTAIMLVSTARVSNDTHKEVIKRLFNLGDVNIRAKQNGQTALMLASSHGQFSTCKLLLEAGAALNVQDNDGSTALMCATEHGQIEIVKLLLSHPDCDPTISDNDKATAMTIAMECGRKDIAVLLYASSNMLSRGSSPYASLRRSSSKAITTQLQRTGSFNSRSNHQAFNQRNLSLAPSPPTRSRTSSVTTTTTSTTNQHRRTKK